MLTRVYFFFEKMNRSEKDLVKVDFGIYNDTYDSSNPLILNKKSTHKAPQKQQLPSQPLSKKQRKKLAAVLKRKRRKLNRAELVEKLSKVQAKPQELDYLTSTASMQTCGLKKFIQTKAVSNDNNNHPKISNIKGTRRKKDLPPKKKMKLDPNTVGFEISSDSSLDVSDDDIEVANDKSSVVNHVNPICSQENALEEATSSAEMTEQSSIPDNIENLKEENISNSQKDVENLNLNLDKKSPSPAIFVSLARLPEVQAAREALPIFCEEQPIMEAIRENAVVVIHGETGSGKTTQVPQFLYEGGYTQNNKMIGITEPRRIAAMTMAARVGIEMNLPDVVAYHVRYENNVRKGTQLKFMTDGVLLKEIRHDFYLSRYSVIIIDEAHERSVFSDVLIGLLSRIVFLRIKRGDPLKLIIMSATLCVQDFVENPKLFKEPPVLIRIDSRQHSVQVHFSIRTPTDYVQAAYQKVCKIHTQLPPGTILVFLTGEKEVAALVKMLRCTYPFKDDTEYKEEIKDPGLSKGFKKRKKKIGESNDSSFCALPSKINLNDYSAEPMDIENLQHQQSDDEDEKEEDSFEVMCAKPPENFMPLYTLPLYSILPFTEQEKVFQPPPAGSRLCVVSTNVAETSITIPGLKYVVDSGKVKTKVYDQSAGGVSKFCITWTSKASANQRAGRAGRTEGGHCYRLYSSSVFDHEFLDFSPPEIQRIPVDDVLLQMKALGIERVVNFPFPSPPDTEALKAAEKRLVLLGALEDLKKGERYKEIKKWEYSAKMTPLGKAMSLFPLSPRYSKMLILSYKHQVVPYMIAIISVMTVPELFVKKNDGGEDDNSGQKRIQKIAAGSGKALSLGDAMVFLRVVALYEESQNKVHFCIRNGIRQKAMAEIHKMCLQLCREMKRAFPDLTLPFEMKLEPPSEDKIQILQKILTTGFTDHVARLYPKEEMKLNKDLKNAYKCLDLEDPVFIHPSSALFSELPRYIIYQEIIHTSKYYMKGIVEINPEWLPAFAPTLCEFSEPLDEPSPTYDSEKDVILCTMNVTFGRWQWEIPQATMEMPKSLMKYMWFGYFLLQGQIHDFFKIYRKHLLSPPSTILKTWAKLIPRIRYLLQALIAKEVDSRKSLEKIWEKCPKFLLREYWEWLPSDKHLEMECKWPPKS